MILRIALKEFYNNVTTPRFVTGFVICFLLIPFSIVISIHEYKSKLGVYEIEKKKADEENLAKTYSAFRPAIIKKPSPLSIFARGISYNVGNRVKVLFGDKPMMTEGKAETRDNPFLNRFFTFDFVSVLIIIISLMAFLFTYDICTGERESGTLKMMLSNSVSRSTILLGKLLGTFFTLFPILLFSFIMCLLVILLSPSVGFTFSEWVRIGMVFLYSIIFLILFMIIGLFVSSRVMNSGTSIVVCLLLWVTFLFIIPNLANYSAKSFIRVGSVENLQYEINALEQEFVKKEEDYYRKQPRPDWDLTWYYWSKEDGFKLIGGATKSFFEMTRHINEFSEPLRIRYADRKWQFRKQYLDRLEKQQKFAEFFSFFSPSEIFKETVSGICATNFRSHNRFLEQIRNYREILIDHYQRNKIFSSYQYFTQTDPRDFMNADEMVKFRTEGKCNSLAEFESKFGGDWKYLKLQPPNSNIYEWKPIDLSSIPKFEYKPAVLSGDIRGSLLHFGTMLGLAVMLFYLSFLSFLNYDVR